MNSNRGRSTLALSLSFATAFLVLLVSAGTPAAYAQVDRAVLEGTISDPSGSVIVGASVKVVAVDTGLQEEQKTNSKGYYRFSGLPVGAYTTTVNNTGFQTKVVEDVILRVGQTRTLDVTLAVGAANEQIEVKASTGPSDRSSAEAATVIDTEQISELPNNGRDWASFTLLAPFAQDDGGGDQRTIRFAGRARDDNNFSFDGVDAGGIQEQAQKSQTRLQISQDAIEEYRVNSALYDAEYGTQAGGQVDVVTKSGTNDWHGTVFGYFRNSVFDARNFNDYNLQGNPAVPPFRMGQYGLTLGGPIQKNKTFFFISYEGLRQFQSITNQFKVPAATNFGWSNTANGGNGAPLTAPFLSNRTDHFSADVPRSCRGFRGEHPLAQSAVARRASYIRIRFSMAGQRDESVKQQQHRPDHGAPSDHCSRGHVADSTRPQNQRQHSLYGRAQRDISLVDAPNGSSLPEDKLQTINHPANYLFALEHTFTPRLFNETKFYVNRSPFHNPASECAALCREHRRFRWAK